MEEIQGIAGRFSAPSDGEIRISAREFIMAVRRSILSLSLRPVAVS